MANGVNDRVFSYLQSAEPDLTFVADEHILPKEIQTVTDEDKKTWKNFSDRLGSLDQMQKRQLKTLWIEGGRPTINIQKKDSEHDGDKNRAWYGRRLNIKAESRDTVNVYEHQLASDFMAEISHGRQYARRSGESVGEWRFRRDEVAKRFHKAKKDFGEDIYGGTDWDVNFGLENKGEIKKWFPYMGSSRKYSIGKDAEGNEIAVDNEGNEYPDMDVPQWKETKDREGEVTSRTRNMAWAYTQPMKAVYDPERRKGFNEQRGKWIKPTTEFEAHEIIEDSLWQDYESRFGSEFGDYGTEWMKQDWRSDEKRDALQDLIKQGLVQ